MALATYSDLLASVASWLNRDDLTAVIPDFVTLFERFANREIRTGAMEAETTLTAGASSPLIDLPADLAEIRWIVPTASPDATLKPISPQQGDTLYSTPIGAPYAYAVVGSQIKVYPTPASGTTFTLHYYQEIPALSDANTTNWLLTDHPDIYLYGTLLQSAPYLMDDGRIQVWGKMLDNGLANLTAADRSLRWNNAAILITGP